MNLFTCIHMPIRVYAHSYVRLCACICVYIYDPQCIHLKPEKTALLQEWCSVAFLCSFSPKDFFVFRIYWSAHRRFGTPHVLSKRNGLYSSLIPWPHGLLEFPIATIYFPQVRNYFETTSIRPGGRPRLPGAAPGDWCRPPMSSAASNRWALRGSSASAHPWADHLPCSAEGYRSDGLLTKWSLAPDIGPASMGHPQTWIVDAFLPPSMYLELFSRVEMIRLR